MNLKNKFLIAVVFAAIVLPAGAGRTEEESLSQKAVNQVIDSLPDFVKDVNAMRTMTPQQKLEYVMNVVDSRVQEKVAEMFKGQIKDKVKEYTQSAIRARAFQEFGVPQIRNAFVMGTAVDWTKIETQIASNVDTKMRMFDAGWKAAEIGWSAYEAYATGDALAAVKSISGSVCDLLAEAYIPGWGWVKFGAKMVEALGNYVLSYATDTAVQGMLESMYGMKSNPQGFADWLIKQSPQQIMADINQKWDDGMAFGYLWQGQGTDKGDETMKSRLQSTLVSLRGELLSKIKEEERKEQEIQQYMQKYKDEAEKKAKDLQDVAKQAKEKVDAILAPVISLRQKYYGIRKQEVKDQEAQIQSQMTGGQGISYVPLNRGKIIGAYQNAFMEVRDVPSDSAFDREAYERLYEEFSKIAKEELDRHLKANEESIQAANNAFWAAWSPQFDALAAQEKAAYDRGDENAIKAIQAQRVALNDRFAPVQAAHGKAVQETRAKVAADRELLWKEYQIVQLEAEERGLKIGTSIRQSYQRINEKLTAANTEFGTGMQTVRAMINKLNYPGLWRSTDFMAGSLGAGYSGPARQIREGTYEFSGAPGHLSGAIAAAEEEERKLKNDLEFLNEIDALERKLYATYRMAVTNIFKDYEAATPKKLRTVNKPPIFSGNQEENLANSMKWAISSGNATSLGEETWGCTGFSYITFPGGYLPIKGVLIPLDFLNKVDGLFGRPQEPYEKAIKQVQQDITSLQGWAQTDELAVMINNLGPGIAKIFDQYGWNGGGVPAVIYKFRSIQDGKTVLLDENTVKDSAGYKYLKAMKDTWEQYGYRVEKLANLAKGYGKGHKYSPEYDPKRYIDRLPLWQGIPHNIEIYEEAMAQAIKESRDSFAQAKKQMDELKDQFKKLKAEAGPSTLKEMRAIQSAIKTIIQYNFYVGGYAMMQEDILKLEKEVDTGIEGWLAEQKKRTEEYQRQQAEEEARRAAEEKARKEKENQEALKRGNPVEFYGYKVVSVRVNTYPVDNASGDIVVTQDKLVQGQIQIDAQLSHVDHIKTLLFSEDGGRTWQQIPVDARIHYTISPIPGKLYNPFIQIKTDDFLVANLKLIPDANGIIYKNEDFSRQVLAAVQALAEAYERQDFSTFSRMISRDYLGNKTFLEEGVRFDFDMFSDISLKIYVNRIEQRTEKFVVESKWDKSQTPRKTGQTQKTTGKTTMMFVMEDGELKIQNLRGDLIYATLSPEIAQASGLSAAKVEQIRTAHDERNPVQPGAGTTDDAGGVSGGILTVQTSPVVNVPGFPGTGFDFTANATTTPSFLGGTTNDVDFEDNQIFGQNFQKITGQTFNGLTTAPTSGYTNLGIANDGAGAVYAFITREGYYGKLEVISFAAAPGGNLRFKFAVQTDGSTNLSTQ